MHQNLFYIPHEWLGLTLAGWGWLLIIWLGISLASLLWMMRKSGWSSDVSSTLVIVVVVGAAIVFLLPKLEVTAPDGTPLGIPIRGYGLMFLMGVVSGVMVAVRLGRKVGRNPDQILSLALWMVIAGIVGARLFYVIQKWPTFQGDNLLETLGAALKFTEGGLVVYGSLIGALAAFLIYCSRHRIPWLEMADVIAPAMAIGLAFGRIGCLLNGCCFGGVNADCPLAIAFPRYNCTATHSLSPPYYHQWATGQLHGVRIGADEQGPVIVSVLPDSEAARSGVKPGLRIAGINGRRVESIEDAYQLFAASGPTISLQDIAGNQYAWTVVELPEWSLPVYPTQIYSSITGFLLFFFLWLLFPWRQRNGQVFAALLTIYPVARFLLEIIRDDEGGLYGTPLTISQWISLITLAAMIPLWIYLLRPNRAASLSATGGKSSQSTGH